MLDVGPLRGPDSTADLMALLDRLAADRDRGFGVALREIRSRVDAGLMPGALQYLATAAATSAEVSVPLQSRRPGDVPSRLVDALAGEALAVLAAETPDEVAEEIAELLSAGRRVLVTAAGADELAAVRSALPDPVGQLCVGAQPPLSPPQLRTLRGLLATETPVRLSRLDEDVPAAEDLPAAETVADLCRQASRSRARSITDLVPGLLAQLDHDRRDAVCQVAQWVQETIDAIGGGEDEPWAWPLLERLVFHRDQRDFEQLASDAAQVETALAGEQTGDVRARIIGRLPADAHARLLAYADFLDAGGRPRLVMRSAAQRAAEPVLAQIEVVGAAPVSRDGVRHALAQVELWARFNRLVGACQELGVPPPADEIDVPRLAVRLRRVEAAARAVGALRHDVLFLRADSPIAVPDLATAAEVARAIVQCSDGTQILDAERELEALVDRVAALVPAERMAAEHRRAMDALAERDADGYAAALDELAAARRQASDLDRCRDLSRSLRLVAPQLAAAWGGAERGAIPGFAVLTTAAALLARLPQADSVDVVIVLGAGQLGSEYLVLAAVAPRMVAVAPRTPAGVGYGEPGSVLAVAGRMGAPMLRAGAPVEPALRNGRAQALPQQPGVPAGPGRRQAPVERS